MGYIEKLVAGDDRAGKDGWIIDKDYFPEGPAPSNLNAKGMMGPRTFNPANVDKCVHKFRMYDDDGELYYEGRCTDIEFWPLDDFGMPNVGCTRIDYYNQETRKWETL